MPILMSLALTPAVPPRSSTPLRAGAWAHAVERSRPRTPLAAAPERTLSTVRRSIVTPPPSASRAARAGAWPGRATGRAARRRARTRGPTLRRVVGSTRQRRDPSERPEADFLIDPQRDFESLGLD